MLTVLAVIFITSCETEEFIPTLDLTNATELTDSDICSVNGGEFILKFNTNTKWEITIKTENTEEWLSFSALNGESGDNEITITTQKNNTRNDRTANIIINAGSISEEITLTQASIEVSESISTRSLNVKKQGGNYKVTFTSGGSKPKCEIDSKDASWISCTNVDESKPNKYVHTITMAMNNNLEVREGKVTFVSSVTDEKFEVKIKQDGSEFSLVSKDLHIDRMGGDISIIIKNNTNYELNLPSWITEKVDNKAASNEIIVFTVSESNELDTREGTITFKPEGLPEASLKITQDGKILAAGPDIVKFPYNGGQFSFLIENNVSYQIEGLPSWISMPDKRALKRDNLILTAEANPTSESREATFTLKSEGMNDITLVARQDGEGEIEMDWNKTFYKTSLIVRFTATWCGYCPAMGKAIAKAMEKHPDRIIPYSIYAGSVPVVNYESTALASYYGIKGYPTAIEDGRAVINSYSSEDLVINMVVNVAKESKEKYDINTSANITTSISKENNTLSVNGTAFFKKAGDYKIAVAITEDNIPGPQTNGGANYIHNYVLRTFLTAEKGNPISFTSDNNVSYFGATISIPNNIINTDNCNVIVYFLKSTDKNTTSVGYAEPTSVKDYVDNAIQVKLGENYSVKFEE